MAYVALGLPGNTTATAEWYSPYLSHAKTNGVLFSNDVNIGSGMSRKDVIWIVWKLLEGTNTGKTPTASCDIKGNISSSGEKIYHLPGCGSYSRTVIDESAGERWFCSKRKALDAGWRKAGNC